MMHEPSQVFTLCEHAIEEWLSSVREWVSVWRLQSDDYAPIESEALDNDRGDEREDRGGYVVGGSRG